MIDLYMSCFPTKSVKHFEAGAGRLWFLNCAIQYCSFLQTCIRQDPLGMSAHYKKLDLVAPCDLKRLFVSRVSVEICNINILMEACTFLD